MSSPTSPHDPTSSPSPSSSSSSVAFSPASSTSSLSLLSSSASSSLPSWHFPFGPSSRYHLSERPQRTHTRVKTSYTPRAPVLSTEQRAHRRAQNNSLGGRLSPVSGEYSRSPLSRFSSYGSSTSSKNSATMARSNGTPYTPAKASRRTSSLQTSPFSDYFSDDARSAVSTDAPAPSTETKALLVKMNKLQSSLMRDQSERGLQAIKIVGRKLVEIDIELDALHSQLPLSTALRDSDVLMAEEKKSVHSPRHSREPSCQSYGSLDSSVASSKIFEEDADTLQQYQAERAFYLSHMQEALAKLNTAQAELRQRQVDFTELHNRHYTILEEKEAELEQLRSENEGLRQDLGFEYSELLFLKLQMKSLEVDIDDLRDENTSQLTNAKRSKKNEILSEMDRWRTDSDWQDVEARFKRRRSKYGIPTSPIRKGTTLLGGASAAEDEIDWQLETVREERGRITSLTIKRMDSSQDILRCADVDDVAEQLAQPVTLSGSTGYAPFAQLNDFVIKSYADHCTQTDVQLEQPAHAEFALISAEEGDQEDEEDTLEEEELDQYEEEEENYCNETNMDAPECATTTSASSASSSEADEDPYQDVEEDEETILDEPTLLSVPHKSAWQELWSSLQSLTGIPDDDEDEY